MDSPSAYSRIPTYSREEHLHISSALVFISSDKFFRAATKLIAQLWCSAWLVFLSPMALYEDIAWLATTPT